MENNEMTNEQFKNIIEMIKIIVETAETKEEAIARIESLSILDKNQ